MLLTTYTTNHHISETFTYSEAPPAEEYPDAEGGAPADTGLTDADIESNWEEAIEAFDSMELPEELLRGIYAYGFEKPSAIQQRAIKPTMLGKDLIAQAQSGTVSKTFFVYWPEFASDCWRAYLRNDDFEKHHLSSLKRVILCVSDKFNSKSDLFGEV